MLAQGSHYMCGPQLVRCGPTNPAVPAFTHYVCRGREGGGAWLDLMEGSPIPTRLVNAHVS